MEAARTLLARTPTLERPCDLDLLIFFVKHPLTLISDHQLARLLGYRLSDVAESLGVLLTTGLLTEARSTTRPERMYVVSADVNRDEPLATIVELGSTREGRLALRRCLIERRRPPDGLRIENLDDATAAATGPAPVAELPD